MLATTLVTIGAGGPSGLWLLVLVSLVRGNSALVNSSGQNGVANRAEGEVQEAREN